MRVDWDNGRAMVTGKVRSSKVRKFSSYGFWSNISCLISSPNLSLGGSRLW